MGWAEAWGHWAAGDLSPHATLFGVEILWWGRFGKIMQALGAATILVEIIGPERLRLFGGSLKHRISLAELGRHFRDSWSWFWAHIQYSFIAWRGRRARDAAGEKMAASWAAIPNLLLSVAIGIWFGLRVDARWFESIWFGFLAWGVSMISIGPAVIALVMTIAIALGALLRKGLIEPLAYVLETKSLDRTAKLLSFVLLVVGFHFDLLSS